MERYRQILEFVRARLGGLKPVHKMLIGSGVVIALMALFIVAQYAGQTRTVTIPVSPDAQAAIIRAMQEQGIDAHPEGPAVRVPMSDQETAMRLAAEHNGLSAASSAALVDLIQKQPWYANRHQNLQNYHAALGQYLGGLIGQWKTIQRADVIISPPGDRATAIGQPRGKPTASVIVFPRAGDLGPDQVEGIAMFVSGAVQGMDPADVNVVDGRTGRALRTQTPDELAGHTYMDLKAKTEAYWEQKIAATLRHIPGVIVAVNAQLDVARETSSDLMYLPENRGSLNAVSSETTTTTETVDRATGGNPGIQPNTGAGIVSGGTAGSGSKSEETNTTFELRPGTKETTRVDPKGYARKVNATVKIPRSYLVRVWQGRNPTQAATTPDDAALAPIESEEVAKIADEVKVLIDTVASSAGDAADLAQVAQGEVVVNTYFDFGTVALGVASPQQAGAGSGFLSVPVRFLGVSWQSVGIMALAGASLFMMFRLVRGAGHQRKALPTAEELVGLPPTLVGSFDDIIGEADESEPAMDAVELDEGDLRSQNLAQQVNDMVNANPDDAARLISRWIQSEV